MQNLKLFISIIGTAVMIYVMGVTGKPLKTATTPAGILNLEFAYNQQKADAVLQAWSVEKWNINNSIPDSTKDKIKAAKLNTWLDFVFLFFYSFLFFNLCSFFYRQLTPARFGKAGLFFAKLSIVTGILDIVENIFMLSVLNNNYTSWYLPIMVFVSVCKWLLVFLILIYCLIGFLKIGFRNKQ